MYEILSTFMMFVTSSYYSGFYDVNRQALSDFLENWLIVRMSDM